ncbi:MAG: hypothetical protein LR001_01295 [Clostridiales bacterium]|nr:hypothetical protein [Clostridiales bacterium]
MHTVSNVLGFCLKDALLRLEIKGYTVVVQETSGKKKLEYGNLRVVKQETTDTYQVESWERTSIESAVKLTVSYF